MVSERVGMRSRATYAGCSKRSEDGVVQKTELDSLVPDIHNVIIPRLYWNLLEILIYVSFHRLVVNDQLTYVASRAGPACATRSGADLTSAVVVHDLPASIAAEKDTIWRRHADMYC